jgi:hypothetical protein
MPVTEARAEAKGHGQAVGLTSTTLPQRHYRRAAWTSGQRDEAGFLTANHANLNPAVFATVARIRRQDWKDRRSWLDLRYLRDLRLHLLA